MSVGFVIATFQNFGRIGAPVQIALHSGVTIEKHPSAKVWIEESSGRGCDFDGECAAGSALVDLIELFMTQDVQCLYRRLAPDFIFRLVQLGHDEHSATLALKTASRWGLVLDGRISEAGRIWWYAERRRQGIELLEGAMTTEQPTTANQVINFSHSTVTGSSFAGGSHATASAANTSPNDVANIIVQVVKILNEGRHTLDLTDEQVRELSDSIEVLVEASASPERKGPGLRVAVRSVLNLAGTLIVGAGGNAVWEAFKALAG
ncbi:hypothetical protein [Actinokineospora globicatena]|uniref:hypothetical protein n=1 Tax=Actinokineospora globicatena TaxID=103729 RepID=UPI0020A44302|nr:hypothetical protein [Actinokineospora globicatena]GLW75915.1 hypothetical protein Aglo01_03970 [Actinokineospora globicatena]GLW82755.1 hypothetical protein Aglo02_03950 [Actinokineospora globicatena]